MTLRFTFIYLIFIYSYKTSAQPLAAYVNIQNQVMVWDDGMIRKIDYLPPVALKVGRTTIPYLDNSRNFKIYYKGGVRTVNIGFTNDFYTTDNLIAFLNASSLKVFDQGNVQSLTNLVEQYFLGDSVLLFLDGLRSEYKAYYNGTVYPIENFLAGSPIQAVKVSDNVIAYNNYSNQFRIFLHGNIIEQEEYAASNFDVGRNTVAYVDINNQFKVFHNGQTFTLENFPPESFTVGDDLVAYVSSDGYFRIFYEDSIQTLGFFRPDYRVGDRVVAYRDGSGIFNVFYKGDVYMLENYYPGNYVVQYNSVAYVNRSSVLRLFTDGEIYDVSTMFSSGEQSTDESWQLSYDVLKYRVGLNLFKVFYKGEEY